ncbi:MULTISPECIES: 2OG-Fe(II) oxygenase [unclassified Leptolyngbya]|uniref:prolyl hydroxylase family protein n=1 Tax=unclassified Leptolyngbya TaxID=2650499 RepID=UPI0016858F63|nr:MULTISPECIES: 2OG-Fe(II) oxygenase [unclassified Leptolyngbya]MBD1909648.1 2OG-Fe(II) oxygenase [Leptolyngbya sp. FACHB-8]MBD2157575.1 2OG-Fe(II) oxygenase [Leptolyngbya sp. FACHB-16]
MTTLSHTLTDLGHEIYLVRNLLAPSVCEHVIQVADSQQFEASRTLGDDIDLTVRGGDIWRLGDPAPLAQSTNKLLMSQVVVVQRLLYEHYGMKFPVAENFSILRYQTGQFYQRHVDNILLANRFQEVRRGIPTRDISVVGYLNDGFQGGETYFDRQDIKVRPEAGSVLIFPAYFTHPHQSLPVTTGTQYVFTTWLFH